YVVAGQITRPLGAITQAVGRVATGDYLASVAGIRRLDEVGDIARAVVSLQAAMRERDALRARALRQTEALEAREAELHK
ncbi:HAMP domain-containing protein, partial [Mycobacterium tuberculosis]|nr:HAMP domain-containing protein [Mycobacterium tuberculosis]